MGCAARPWAGGRGGPGSRAPSYSPGRFRWPSCRPIMTPGTCSPCRAGPGGAAWTSRGSGSSTWKRLRRACRWWAATPVGRPTRSWTAGPATWCPATNLPRGQLDFGDQVRIIAQLGWCGAGRASVLLLPELQRLGVQGDQAGDVRPGVADHDALADQRVGAEPVLEHGGRHVLAASGDDEFLLPPGDPPEALLVHAAGLAAPQPALLVPDPRPPRPPFPPSP